MKFRREDFKPSLTGHKNEVDEDIHWAIDKVIDVADTDGEIEALRELANLIAKSIEASTRKEQTPASEKMVSSIKSRWLLPTLQRSISLMALINEIA